MLTSLAHLKACLFWCNTLLIIPSSSWIPVFPLLYHSLYMNKILSCWLMTLSAPLWDVWRNYPNAQTALYVTFKWEAESLKGCPLFWRLCHKDDNQTYFLLGKKKNKKHYLLFQEKSMRYTTYTMQMCTSKLMLWLQLHLVLDAKYTFSGESKNRWGFSFAF